MSKASRQVTLVLSGALSMAFIAGCTRDSATYPDMQVEKVADSNSYTNNTHDASRGYYHSSAHLWYPYSYGYYETGRGYFYDGQWSSTPRVTPPALQESVPQGVARPTAHATTTTRRGGFGYFGRSSVS